jgi:hypothetical protein
MSKTKNPWANKKLIILFLISIVVFIAKAFFRLPISQKNIDGHGLYSYISIFQFIELAFATYFCIFLSSKYFFKLQNLQANILALGFSNINLGLLLIDVRLHQYNFIIEQYIQNKYGSPIKFFLIAISFIIIGAILANYSISFSSKSKKK